MPSPSRTARRFALIAMFALAVGFGVDAALVTDAVVIPERTPHQGIFSICFAVAGLVWCGADARIRGWNLVWPARIGILVFGPLGLFAYLVWSRGWRGVLIALSGTLAWFAVEVFVFVMVALFFGNVAWP